MIPSRIKLKIKIHKPRDMNRAQHRQKENRKYTSYRVRKAVC